MLKRTCTCGEPRKNNSGETITLSGWINTYRDQGKGLVFIDLRDRYGMTQVVFDAEDTPTEVMDAGSTLRREDVISVTGEIRLRDGKPNARLATGEIELVAKDIEVINRTAKLPILPDDHDADKIGEEHRLKYRYIDLRRPAMQKILKLRHQITQFTRNFFASNDFLEIETPLLITPTPEGARDFIVPSRHQEGCWYALPQSPQIFKQILMVAGCDKYLQICKCLRDEDPRADRQAEFTQIDLEMSFVDQDDVLAIMSEFATGLYKEVGGIDLGDLPHISWKDAMDKYGSDRPDTRFDLQLQDVTELASKTDFKVFNEACESGGNVKAMRVPGGAEKLSRKKTDAFAEVAKTYGAGGLPVVKYEGGKFVTGVAKFVEPIKEELVQALGLEDGDIVMFGVGSYRVACTSLGEVRLAVAKELDLIPKGLFRGLWVIDFPMFDWNEEGQRWVSEHHPFTAPLESHLDILESDPENCLSSGYDLVINGAEVGGGSIRIHTPEIQSKVFGLLGLSQEEAEDKFGFLLNALRFGAPPHGGVAFGLDRLVMMMIGTDNIRDVIAFPKTQTGADLMCEAPGIADPNQLDELGIIMREPVQTTEPA
ncbi:MAG: aspartate--tRNA ligase [Phycisphaerales bacterium]|nr:aspartate--tRNA ligase [Planctomycetota bacterium]MBL6997400.1 aspartate--tRNA ligase [Phycisphaerales bacterium]